MWAGRSKFRVFDEFIRMIISTYFPNKNMDYLFWGYGSGKILKTP
jgi:hypothetical protein